MLMVTLLPEFIAVYLMNEKQRHMVSAINTSSSTVGFYPLI